MAADDHKLTIGVAALDLADYVVDLDVLANPILETELHLDRTFSEKTLQQQRIFFTQVAARNVGQRSTEARDAHHARCVVGRPDSQDDRPRALFADHPQAVKYPSKTMLRVRRD